MGIKEIQKKRLCSRQANFIWERRFGKWKGKEINVEKSVVGENRIRWMIKR